MTVVIILRRIDSKSITCENDFPLRKYNLLLKTKINILEDIFLQETRQKICCLGIKWCRLYQKQDRQYIVFKHRITWINLFGKSSCQIWRGMNLWLNIWQQLQNYQTWWLRLIGEICEGRTHPMICLLFFLFFK